MIWLLFGTNSLKIHVSVFPVEFAFPLLTYLNLNTLLALLTFTHTLPAKPGALLENFQEI